MVVLVVSCSVVEPGMMLISRLSFAFLMCFVSTSICAVHVKNFKTAT